MAASTAVFMLRAVKSDRCLLMAGVGCAGILFLLFLVDFMIGENKRIVVAIFTGLGEDVQLY